MFVIGMRQLIGAIVILLAASSTTSQEPDKGSGAALIPFADSLHAQGIDTSRISLIAALRNSDPQVRSLAALQLAQDHDTKSVHVIENALKVEKDTEARITIAGALRSLHDPNGVAYLQTMCSDTSVSINVLVRVVQDLTRYSESTALCADRVLSFLDSHNDSDSKQQVLWTLAGLYPSASPNQADRIVRLLQDLLVDQSSTVRMQAGDALVQIGSPSSMIALRSAISKEQDSQVRSHLQ
jgi:HEAT repeat protein